MENLNMNQPFQEDLQKTSIKRFLIKYLPYWHTFMISLILSFIVAFLYTRYATPVYNISSTILIKGNDNDKILSGNADINNTNYHKNEIVLEDEVDILKSKSLMNKVLTDLSLYTSYYSVEPLKTKEIYGRSLPLQVIISELDTAVLDRDVTMKIHIKNKNSYELEDESGYIVNYKFNQEIQKPFGIFRIAYGPAFATFSGKNFKVVLHNPKELLEYYNKALYVEIANKANKEAKILNVGLTEPVQEKGRDIINKLIDLYNKEALKDKNLVASNTIQFIDERLKYLTSELSDVELDIEHYKKQNLVTDVSSDANIYLENSSEYQKRLSQLEVELNVLSSIEKYLNEGAQNSRYDLVPSTLAIQDPTLSNLIINYNELQTEHERMLRTLLPNNPLVQNITEQLDDTKRKMLETVGNIKNGLIITRRNLEASSAKFVSNIQKIPLIERELLEVKRQQGIKQELYLYLLQKREESALSLAATNFSSARVIDPATADALPISPKKRSVFMLAFLVGLGLPFALLYIKNTFNDKIRQKSDVVSITATPILGEIAHNDTDGKIVFLEGSKTPIAELFRLIRTNFLYESLGKENQAILVTSSMSGEGKTFFASNFGTSLAIIGKKTVVLDLDFRAPKSSQDLNMADGSGITDYLTDVNISLADIIQQSPITSNLFFINSGFLPQNPGELMMDPKLGLLLTELREKFDYIIMDTAPVGLVSDALSLHSYTDLMIFVIRLNFSSKSQLGIINDIYVDKKFGNTMMVLNDVPNSGRYGYSYLNVDDKT